MSSVKKKIEEESLTRGETFLDKLYHYFYETYDYLIKKGNVFYFVIFIYYVLNNYYFENGKYESGGLLNVLGIIILIVFYLSFANFLRASFKKMADSFLKPGETHSEVFKNGEFILLLSVTICTFILGVFLMPNLLLSAGIISKGFMRVWNPFHFKKSDQNVFISDKQMYGYDTDGLYWGGEGFFEKILFKFLSFPSVLSTAMFGFYQYLIPLFFGDGLRYVNPVDWGLIGYFNEDIRKVYENTGFWRNALVVFLLFNSIINNLMFPAKGSISFTAGLQIVFVSLSIVYIIFEGNEYMKHLGYTPSNQSGKPTMQDLQNTMTNYVKTKIPGFFLPKDKPQAAQTAQPVPTATPVTQPVPLATPVAQPVPLATPVAQPVPLATPVAQPAPLAPPAESTR